MGNYNRGGDRGGRDNRDRGDRGGRDNRDRGGRDRERPQMHKAVCSDCGNNCEVPFRPTGDKPIYCSDCFSSKRSDGRRDNGDRGGRDSRDRRPRFDDKKPFRNDNNGNGGNDKVQFDILNRKLDKILKALAPVISEDVQETEKPKKDINKEALKKELSKVIDGNLPTKKPATKKKVADKKTVAKKTTKKKDAVKKVEKVKVAKKKASPKKKPAKKVTKKKVVKNKK